MSHIEIAHFAPWLRTLLDEIFGVSASADGFMLENWPGSWSTRIMDEVAWAALREELQTTYDRVVARLMPESHWPDVRVDSLMMLLGHSAYHVGQVRLLLTAVKART